ncbi:DUF167 family protein [bacterium]|nr:DUF167 family protein [bacterium]
MYIRVKVMPAAKKEGVERVSDDAFKISVKEPASRNMANTRVREILAKEYAVAVAKVRLINGHQSPSKLFSIIVEEKE